MTACFNKGTLVSSCHCSGLCGNVDMLLLTPSLSSSTENGKIFQFFLFFIFNQSEFDNNSLWLWNQSSWTQTKPEPWGWPITNDHSLTLISFSLSLNHHCCRWHCNLALFLCVYWMPFLIQPNLGLGGISLLHTGQESLPQCHSLN